MSGEGLIGYFRKIRVNVLKVATSLQVAGVTIDANTLAVNGLTASAAEMNLNDGAVAGTAVASKTLALGADKNVDTLAIADGGLKLGAGAGTAVLATAAELNILDTATVTAAELNEVVAATGLATDGLTRHGVARVTFDAGVVGNQSIAAHASAVQLPINAIVVGGFFEVNTAFTSNGGNAGTIAISVEGANDIQTAAAVSGAPYSTIGKKAITPKNNTPESTGVKCTAARAVTFTVGGQTLIGGKLTLFLEYVVSVVSA